MFKVMLFLVGTYTEQIFFLSCSNVTENTFGVAFVTKATPLFGKNN